MRRLESFCEGGIRYLFEPAERETAEQVRAICAESVRVTQEQWELPLPRGCRVYVLASWWQAALLPAPLPLRLWYAATLPLWRHRARNVWSQAAAWTQPYRSAPAVVVKPQRLWTKREDSIGRRIYRFHGPEDRMRNVVCHEMVHACANRLRLPLWLNEGLAMLTVDRLLGRQTVRTGTLPLLAHDGARDPVTDYRRLGAVADDAVVHAYVRGYWLTRFLAESHPDLLRGLIARRMSRVAIDYAIGRRLSLRRQALWREIDVIVAAHFADLPAD